MVPLFLQSFLIEELRELYNNLWLKNQNEVYKNLNFFSQYLPDKKIMEGSDPEYAPHVRVILYEGVDSDAAIPYICSVMFEIATYDKKGDYQGYRDGLNVVETLYQHLIRKRVLDGKYEIQYPIKWNVSEEDTYPYFYAYLDTRWAIFKATSTDINL